MYQPSGQGDHIYVQIRREGLNTRDLVRSLADLFGLREVDVGCAGQKDKQARVTQTFSLLLPGIREEEAGRRIKSNLPVEVLSVVRHGNKLKTGHLLGNAFNIVLQEPIPDAPDRAGEIAAAILSRGLPNYYGVQRFGADGDNADKGREILMGRGPRQHWLRRFLLSAFQSLLFNDYLAERIRRDWFGSLLTGDLAKKTDTGGMFEVTELEKEKPRFMAGEITYTGPIFGHKNAPGRRRTGPPGSVHPGKTRGDRSNASSRQARRLPSSGQVDAAQSGNQPPRTGSGVQLLPAQGVVRHHGFKGIHQDGRRTGSGRGISGLRSAILTGDMSIFQSLTSLFRRIVLNDRLGSLAGGLFFLFWIGQRYYFFYRPTILWWLITFQFCLFVAAYFTRRRAREHAQGFWETVYPFIVAAMPLALDNYPFKPAGKPLFALVSPYLALMIVGSGIIVLGIFFLRRSFSIMTEVREPVFRGIYRITRHPMYLGSMVASAGLLGYNFNFLNLSIFIVYIVMQVFRANNEEKKIAGVFPEYGEYAARVGWFWVLGRKR